MESQMGLAHFWSQGDLVTHTTAIILALLGIPDPLTGKKVLEC